MRRFLFLFLLVGLSHLTYSNAIVIVFYGQKITFEYDESIISKRKLKPNEKELEKFHEAILISSYKSLLDGLQNSRKELQLNDWLYYLLIDKLCNSLDNRETNASYLKWFLLGKSGYRLRMAFSKHHAGIFVETADAIEGLPKFSNTYCINCNGLDLPQYTFARLYPFRKNKVKFSFFFDPLPKFTATSYISRTFRLRLLHSGGEEDLEIKFDSVLMSCQREIVGFNLQQTFSVSLTTRARKLLDRITEITQNYSDSIRVNYLMDFVFRNSVYSLDVENKWATPEEFLFNGAGDCEDRSAFMFYALKEILKKPVVIVEYPGEEHVNVAVSIDLRTPPDFVYKGKPYYICETSISGGFTPLGKFNLQKSTKYKITGEYDPGEVSQEEKP